MKLFKGIMPDITPAQVVAAVVGSIFPVLTLLGVDLTAAQTDAVNQLKYLALGLFGADAVIRVGRSHALKGKIGEMKDNGHVEPTGITNSSLFAPALTPDEEAEATRLEKDS